MTNKIACILSDHRLFQAKRTTFRVPWNSIDITRLPFYMLSKTSTTNEKQKMIYQTNASARQRHLDPVRRRPGPIRVPRPILIIVAQHRSLNEPALTGRCRLSAAGRERWRRSSPSLIRVKRWRHASNSPPSVCRRVQDRRRIFCEAVRHLLETSRFDPDGCARPPPCTTYAGVGVEALRACATGIVMRGRGVATTGRFGIGDTGFLNSEL